MSELFGDRLFTALEQTDVEQGMLLVAAPNIADSVFRRRVVLVAEVVCGYVRGVMLDVRTDRALANELPDWEAYSSDPKIIFEGGFDDPDLVIPTAVLKPGITYEDLWDVNVGADYVFNGVSFVNQAIEPEEYEDYVEGIRIYRGCFLWPLSSLEGWIEGGDWYVIPALPSDVMTSGKVDLWQTVLRRQPMPLPLFSTYPAYPINN